MVEVEVEVEVVMEVEVVEVEAVEVDVPGVQPDGEHVELGLLYFVQPSEVPEEQEYSRKHLPRDIQSS